MKPSEEIKRKLVTCTELVMPADVQHAAMVDALAYIQQLERERDAVVYYYIAKKKECRTCKHFSQKESDEPCMSCGIGQSRWEWRGLEEDDRGKEEL